MVGELYGLPPEQFTARRNALAKEARRAGDRERAEAIGALGKPNRAAWLVNQMTREYPDELAELLELGAGLRDATAALDAEQLRELGAQQRRVVHALVQQARSLGRAAGHPVSEDTARGVEETLHAALADAGAAEQVRAGRLTEPLSSSGFPSAGTTASASGGGERSAATGRGRADARVAAEERDLAAARVAAEERDLAAARVAAAERDLADARAAAERAGAERDRADEALREAEAAAEEAAAAHAEADKAVRARRAEVSRAQRGAREAERRVRDATERRRRLGDD